MYTLAIIGVVASVVGAFYYLRIVKIMYFDEAVEPFDLPLGKGLSGVITITVIITLLFFFFLSPVLDGAATAAAALTAG
jgi:NADH-quinone oxidoreductase subunit N